MVIFPDGKYLRDLLIECAKAFFGAKDGSREAELISLESYSDCIVRPAKEAKLTVEDGAFLVGESCLRPVEADRKLFVLDAFHTASALVQNKLLKLLEEPPEGVYFLLGATADYTVLPTVRSRVTRIEEPPFSEEDIFSALQRSHGGEGDLRAAATACGGIYSSAEALLVGGGEDFRLAERFLSGDAVSVIKEIADRKEKTPFLAALRLTLRDMLLVRSGREEFASGRHNKALCPRYETGALIASLELVSEAEKQIKFNAGYAQCLTALSIAIGKEREKWQKLS